MGSCSWNYDSWVGLVYSRARRTAAEYLPEYSRKYSTVEIDSWFYKLPSEAEVEAYGASVGEDFSFTCKAPQELSTAFLRGRAGEKNPRFLSPELYSAFCDRVSPLGAKLGAVILEFEYMNRQKMPSLREFLARLGVFVDSIPRALPLGIECRNGNYLGEEYFSFLRSRSLVHVFSEKQYMPPILTLLEDYGDFVDQTSILRLLGDDRGEIEAKTAGRWDKIVEEKPQKPGIARAIKNLLVKGKRVVVNVNNHFEGSAPLTIESMLGML